MPESLAGTESDPLNVNKQPAAVVKNAESLRSRSRGRLGKGIIFFAVGAAGVFGIISGLDYAADGKVDRNFSGLLDFIKDGAQTTAKPVTSASAVAPGGSTALLGETPGEKSGSTKETAADKEFEMLGPSEKTEKWKSPFELARDNAALEQKNAELEARIAELEGSKGLKGPGAQFASATAYDQARLNLEGIDTNGDDIKDGIAEPIEGIEEPTPKEANALQESVKARWGITLTEDEAYDALEDGGFKKGGATYEIWESKQYPGTFYTTPVDAKHELVKTVVDFDAVGEVSPRTTEGGAMYNNNADLHPNEPVEVGENEGATVPPTELSDDLHDGYERYARLTGGSEEEFLALSVDLIRVYQNEGVLLEDMKILANTAAESIPDMQLNADTSYGAAVERFRGFVESNRDLLPMPGPGEDVPSYLKRAGLMS